MSTRALEAYRIEKIVAADPIELVRLLYKGAVEAVEAARRCLGARDIRGRSAAISKGFEILGELIVSLDHERAPELSRRLAELYDYMQHRLLAANLEQADAPLAEVLGLLETLAGAWNQVPAAAFSTPVAVPQAWNPQAEPAPAAQGWSF
ncbi:MAG TPA: flagellar export chaperone FliS [Bryobacteraceae bacterium]|nr:flagellar export chaperone FliS [Bryobacteraceae bacterium]